MKSTDSQRFLLLDVMRAIAVLMMIQGHTIDALLSPAAIDTNSSGYAIWQYFRGLTAPIFLFGSGFAYVIASSRKSVGGKLPRAILWKRIRWISVLFTIGVLMHFPVPSFSMLPSVTAEQWEDFNHVDILRLMGITLFGLLAVFLTTREPRRLVRACLIVALAVVVLAPVMYDIHWRAFLPDGVAGYLSVDSGSNFPIFPFSAYLFAGAAAAGLYLGWKQRGLEKALVPRFFVFGVAAIAVAFVPIAAGVPGNWLTMQSPFLFFLRLGSVLVFWSVAGTVIGRLRRLPRIVPIVGQHTLLIYVSHVVFVYGSAWSVGLKQFYDRDLTLLPVLAVIGGILAGSVLLAYGMHVMKHERAHIYRFVPYVGTAIMALFMMVVY